MWNPRVWGWFVLVACAACATRNDHGSPSANGGEGPPASGARAPQLAAVSGAASTPEGAAPKASAGMSATGGARAAAGGGGSGATRTTGDADAGPDPTDARSAESPRSTGPGDWVAGDYPKDMEGFLELAGLPGQAGNARQYKVHVPASYDPKVAMPIVFCIHGLGQDAVLFCVDGAGMPAKSDAAGFILVMPNGYQNSWNAGTCCGGAVTDRLDDVGFIRALFKELSKHLNIDLTRVYATGLSNGGYMSYRLACEASDLFVAVAPGAGAIGMNDIGGGTSSDGDFKSCKPTAHVAVLDLHGTEDPLIPYALQKPSLERIAEQNGCALTTHTANQPLSAGDTMCVSHDGCPAGIDVTGCTVKGGGHVWFGSANCGTGVDAACGIVGANSDTLVNTDAVWAFFSAHARAGR